jgi:hypothetical protein
MIAVGRRCRQEPCRARIKSVTGKDLFQAQREADYAGRLYTPEQVAQFVNDSRKDGFQDKIIYYYINALISGPLTHARYAVGNMINVLAKPLLITPVSAVAGRVGEAVGLQAPGDRVYMREAGAELYAIIKGSQDGIKAAVEAMKTGVSPPLPGERLVMHEIQLRPPIGGWTGFAIGLPGRGVAGIHSFFKSVRYEQEKAARSVRQALSEGHEGDALTNRIAELEAHPTQFIIDASDDLAEGRCLPAWKHGSRLAALGNVKAAAQWA